MTGLTRREFLQGMVLAPGVARRLLDLPEQKKDSVWQTFLPFIAGGIDTMPLKISWFEADTTEHTLHDSSGTLVRIGECDGRIVRINGFGMPKVLDTNEPKGENQDGITWVKSRLDPRVLSMMIQLDGRYDELWRSRRELARWFNPLNSNAFDGILRVDTGVQRDINCRYRDGLKFDDEVKDYDNMILPLELWAKDPLWYDPTQNSIIESHNPPPDTYNFSITNNGDWDGGTITIQIDNNNTGTIVDPVIENTTTGQKLELDYTIDTAFAVVYTIAYGNRSVKVAGTSIIEFLSDDSDLGEFKIQPGVNNFTVSWDAAKTATTIRTLIKWFDQYLTA